MSRVLIAVRIAATLISMLITVALIAAARASPAGQGYAAPDVGEWYRRLRQPDRPEISCCGDADAYYADAQAPCAAVDPPDCALVAIITDERPDEISYRTGNGEERRVRRPHVDRGTRVPIPRAKLRHPAIVNPTEHTVVFLSTYGVVYCYEPVGLF